ncbi:MAG: hypothetical protein IH600_15285 [Bacteroidetes bacterium]|nr:hypothetical protein [Bacteroidota bacterium]
MNATRILLLLAVLFTVVITALSPLQTAVAQDAAPTSVSPARTPWYLGISAGVFYSMHSGGFSFPGDCEGCGVYGDASGLGSALDLRLSIPIARWLRIEPRIFGECHRGDFTSDPIASEIIGKDMKPQAIVLEDELSYTLRLIGIDLMASVQIGRTGLAVLAGPALGFHVSETATVNERIASPDGALFIDGSRDHTVYDDDVAMARSMHAGLRAGIGYTLPLNQDLALGFEATWLLPLQTVGEDHEWKTAGVRGLLSVLFAW